MNPKEVIEHARTHGCEIIDLKFSDMLGLWQHFSIPTSELVEDMLDVGLGFDGSSIRGWQAIHASDMLVMSPILGLRQNFLFWMKCVTTRVNSAVTTSSIR